MAKIEDNELYAIKRSDKDDMVVLEEKLYTFKKGKVHEKHLNTYENITLAEKNEK